MDEVQSDINNRIIEELSTIRKELEGFQKNLMDLKEVVISYNTDRDGLFPFIMATYKTMALSDKADELEAQYQYFIRRIGEEKGGSILKDLFGGQPPE